jgi:hypothetical protein
MSQVELGIDVQFWGERPREAQEEAGEPNVAVSEAAPVVATVAPAVIADRPCRGCVGA